MMRRGTGRPPRGRGFQRGRGRGFQQNRGRAKGGQARPRPRDHHDLTLSGRRDSPSARPRSHSPRPRNNDRVSDDPDRGPHYGHHISVASRLGQEHGMIDDHSGRRQGVGLEQLEMFERASSSTVIEDDLIRRHEMETQLSLNMARVSSGVGITGNIGFDLYNSTEQQRAALLLEQARYQVQEGGADRYREIDREDLSGPGPGQGRYSTDTRSRRDDYYKDDTNYHDRPRPKASSMSESSPEYFSTNYPTTEYDEMEYRTDEQHHHFHDRYERNYHHHATRSHSRQNRSRTRSRSSSQSPERYSNRDRRGRGSDEPQSHYADKENDSYDDDLDRQRSQSPSHYDRKIDTDERDCESYQRNSPPDVDAVKMSDSRSRSRSRDLSSPQRNVGEMMLSQLHSPHREMERGSPIPIPPRGQSQERGQTGQREHGTSHSRSSSLSKELPGSPVSMEKKSLDMRTVPPPQSTTQLETKLSEEEGKSLFITVTNDQFKGEQQESMSALDRLGPPVPPVPPAAKEATERLGPPVTAPVTNPKRKPKAPVADNDDFDLYADIPPPSTNDDVLDLNIGQPKQDLVITFQPKQEVQMPVTTSETLADSGFTETKLPVDQLKTEVNFKRDADIKPSDIGKEEEKQHLEAVPPVADQAPTIVTIPKSKWDSDDEGTEQHIILVPQTQATTQKVEAKKEIKKRDPSLHMGQIVKDIRLNQGKESRAKKSGEVVKEKSMHDSDKNNQNDSKMGDEKKQIAYRKQEKSAGKSRSRSQERKKDARETDRRRDDRHRSSDRRDQDRDRHRYTSSSSRGKYSHGRSGSRYGNDRGNYRDYRDRRYDRRRSRSQSRDRRSRRDRHRSRSRSTSDSSNSSKSSKSSSSRSSSTSSSGTSPSREHDQTKQNQGSKQESAADGKHVNQSASTTKSNESTADVTTEYDIFSGNIIITRKLEENIQPSKKKEEEELARTSAFAKVGGLSDPLGLKQLTKPHKSKVYSGPIIDMPPLTVTATTEPATISAPVPLATAKPLKSILKKQKKPASDAAAPVSVSDINPGVSNMAVTSDNPPISSGNGVNLEKISSFLATLIPTSGHPQAVAQPQHQLSQVAGSIHPQRDTGFLGTGGRGVALPGLGEISGQSVIGQGALASLLGVLRRDQLSSLPGLGGLATPSMGLGGISTSSITGFGGIPSATLASVPPQSAPGLGDLPSSNALIRSSAVGGLFPSADNMPFQSVSQQSNVASLPGLLSMLGGLQQSDLNSGQSSITSGFQSFNTSLTSSRDIPFLTDSQSENQHSVEEEDRFLYGEPSDKESSRTDQTQGSTQEEYVPQAEPQVQSSVDPNQIQNILSAIGFDFDMAKQIAVEKEKERQVQESGQSKTPGNQATNIADYLKSQRTEVKQKVNTDKAEDKSVPNVDYKLEDLNQNASFLDTGLQMPDRGGTDGSAVKTTKKIKKKKDKAGGKKTKGKKTGKTAAIQESLGDAPNNDRHGQETQTSHDNLQRKEQREQYTEEQHMTVDDREESTQSRRERSNSEGYIPESHSKTLDSTRRHREEPVNEGEQYYETQRKQSRYPSDLANIKIQVAQESSNSELPPSRRIVLLPPEHQEPLSYEEERYIIETQPPESWHMQQKQLQEEEYYRRKEWEANELRRLEEKMREEYRLRENEEKEKRRRDMLKKEQEWLMREVALKTMEEKIRREEEKLMREKDARRRDDQRRDESKQYRLKKDKEEYQRKLHFLEKELVRLRKQQGDLMRRKQRQKDGHKDPELAENNQLQDDITSQIRSLRKAYSGVADRDSERSRRDERDEKNRRSLSTDRLSTSKDDRDKEKDKGSSRQDKRDLTELKQEGKSRFEFVYFDPGEHWCKVCQKSLTNLDTYFVHLHSKRHMQNCDPHERPWMPSDFKLNKPTPSGTVIPAPAKGAELMMPVNGFYCRLCKTFLGDGVCASEHMKGPQHNLAYQKFVDENKQYERQLKLERDTSMANQSSVDKLDDEDHVDDEKGAKRKCSTSESEKQSKIIKKEDEAVKITGKQKGGFGRFEFDKEKDKGDASGTEYGPALPVELRKETSSDDKVQKKDPNKLTIKIGTYKRLIPSALLRAKGGATTAAPAQTSETTASTTTTSTPEVTTRQPRSTRSATAALRALPMIGKRPVRKPKEVPKESPKEKEPLLLPASSLELFLQVGGSQDGGGKALPIIKDVKDDKEADKAKDTAKEEATKFLLKESDIASAFEGEGQSDDDDIVKSAVPMQDNAGSEDEMEDIPPVPGAEDFDGDLSGLPKPIPPPPAD